MTGPPPPNPRIALGLLAVIVVLQGIFAGSTLFTDPSAAESTVRLIAQVAFVAYAAIIVAFVVGVWRQARWAWAVGLAAAGYGLALAGLQVLGGDPLDRHLLGMAIDAALLYYLTKASTRALFDA